MFMSEAKLKVKTCDLFFYLYQYSYSSICIRTYFIY